MDGIGRLYNRDLYSKKVFTLVFHPYLSDGLGDFFRGCLAALRICEEEKIPFFIDLKHHPISRHFKNDCESPFEYTFSEIISFEQLFTGRTEESEESKRRLRTLITRCTEPLFASISGFSDLFEKRRDQEISRTFWQGVSLSKHEQQIFKKLLTFSAEVEAAYTRFLVENQLCEKKYGIIHFRFGDRQLLEEQGISSEALKHFEKSVIDLNKCLEKLELLQETICSPLVVLSDSNRLKNLVKNEANSNVLASPTKSTHSVQKPGALRLSPHLIELPDQGLFDLALDMRIIKGAQISWCFSHQFQSSGFPVWVSNIFDVPFLTYQIGENPRFSKDYKNLKMLPEVKRKRSKTSQLKKPLKISVITPSYNSDKYIERAIESVLVQDYPHWEHIIMDGASTDQTVEKIKKYEHLIWTSEKDQGQTDAMNKGFKKSTGDIIVYLNSDDYFFPGAFSAIVREFSAGATFVVGDILIKSARLNTEFLNTPKTTYSEMLKHWEPNAFPCNSLGYFYKREVQESCPFNTENDLTMDLEFLLDAAAKYDFSKINFTLGCFEDGANTKTGLSQSRLDCWKPSNFSFIDRHLERKKSPQEIENYKAERRLAFIDKQAETHHLGKGLKRQLEPEQAPLISVIVPNYNGGKYISRCINSILTQSATNLEIIVVDDHSSDNSIQVLESSFGRERRLTILKQETNKKQGAARNVGLNLACGKYIFFVDSDDWIERESLLTLVSIAEEYQADLVACGVSAVNEKNDSKPYHGFSLASDDLVETLNYFADHKIGSIVWNKLYLSDLIKKNRIQFPENSFYEDVAFSLEVLCCAKNFISIQSPFYNYFQRADSCTRLKSSVNIESCFRQHTDFLNVFSKYRISPELAKKVLKSHLLIESQMRMLEYFDQVGQKKWAEDLEKACVNQWGNFTGFVISEMLKFSLGKSR